LQLNRINYLNEDGLYIINSEIEEKIKDESFFFLKEIRRK
jgi:hypothetical protein